MFNERSALERIFNNLEAARERRYQQYLDEIKAIEEQQEKLLADLRRIDEESHIHSELVQTKKEEAKATADVKKRLAAMDQNLVPPPSNERIKETEDGRPILFKKREDETKATQPISRAERPGIPEKALDPVFENGKKIYPNGNIQYQTHYICTSCKDRKTIYVGNSALYCYCKACNKRLKLQTATSKGYPHQDDFGNYFIAGSFVRLEDQNKIIPDNPVDVALAKYNAEQEAKKAEQEAAAADPFPDDDETAKAYRESAKYSLN